MARSIDVRTSDTDEAVRLCEQVYFPHHLTVHRGCGDFTMSLTARNFGPVAVGLLSYTGPVRLSTGPLETAYQVNVPLTGELATSSGGRRVVADRTTAAVYQPDDDAVLDGWVGGGTVLGVKIDRASVEGYLRDLLGSPVDRAIPAAASLDLSRGAGREWWVLTGTLVELLHSPEGLLNDAMVGSSIARTLVAGFVHAVDHPFREGLDQGRVARSAWRGQSTSSKMIRDGSGS